MDCSGCPTALGCQLYNSLHGSESASRRVPLSRPQHHRDISRQIDLTAANCRFKQRRAHDEPLWSRIGQIDRRGFSAMSSFSQPHQGNTVQVTMSVGKAHQTSSIEKDKTAQWRQERVLATAGARRRKPQGTKPIEEPLWELLNIGIRP